MDDWQCSLVAPCPVSWRLAHLYGHTSQLIQWRWRIMLWITAALWTAEHVIFLALAAGPGLLSTPARNSRSNVLVSGDVWQSMVDGAEQQQRYDDLCRPLMRDSGAVHDSCGCCHGAGVHGGTKSKQHHRYREYGGWLPHPQNDRLSKSCTYKRPQTLTSGSADVSSTATVRHNQSAQHCAILRLR